MAQLKHLIEVWTGYGQGLAGSIGALAFVFAFIWTMVEVAKAPLESNFLEQRFYQ